MSSLVHKLQHAYPIWDGQMASKIERKQPKTCPEGNPVVGFQQTSTSLWNTTWNDTAHGHSGLWVSLRESSRNWAVADPASRIAPSPTQKLAGWMPSPLWAIVFSFAKGGTWRNKLQLSQLWSPAMGLFNKRPSKVSGFQHHGQDVASPEWGSPDLTLQSKLIITENTQVSRKSWGSLWAYGQTMSLKDSVLLASEA